MSQLTTPELLDLLDARGTILPEHLAKLRQLHAGAPQEFTVRVILKWLINRGAINPQNAEQLLQMAGDSFVEGGRKPAASLADELGLAPLDEDERQKPKAPTAPQPLKPPPPVAPARPQPPMAVPLATPVIGPADELFSDAAFQKAAGVTENPALTGRAPIPVASKPKKNVWDSPLLLIGGGVLLLLVFAGAFLLWSLRRETGDEALQLAEADFRAGSYTQAIHKYDEYLKRYPTHNSVSLARVHRGLARLRQAVDGARDWPQTLQTAREVLSEISTEEKFSEAHGDLASMLPTIAEGLARQAVESPAAAKLAEAREALEMIKTYVFPPGLRPEQKMADIEAELAVASRKLDQEKSLAETIAAIEQAIADGRSDTGYELRRKLIKTYPELRDNEALRNAVAAISQAQRQAVRSIAESREAVTTEPDSPVRASLAWARRFSGSTSATQGEPTFVLADGAAYGLDSATGRLLWRRFVGFDTSFVPRRVGSAADGEALVVDSVRHELLRIKPSGELRWRAALGEPFVASPAVLRDKALVATLGGKLVSIELATGKVTGLVHVPQPLRVAPATDAREKLHYQLGDHSNLFVISAADGACAEVFYLGHEPNCVRVSPTLVGPYVLVAENRFADKGLLHVLRSDENGVGLKKVQEIPFVGHVHAPPEVAGRTVFLATDRGEFSAWEVSTAAEGPALVKVIDRVADASTPIVPFSLLRGGRLFVAGRGLTQFDVQTSRGRLTPAWEYAGTGIFLHAPQPVGASAVVTVHRRAGLPGVVASAVNIENGKPLWGTELGVPTTVLNFKHQADEPLAALSATGAFYHLPDDKLEGSRTSDEPAAGVTTMAVLDLSGTRVNDATWAFVESTSAAGRRRLLEVTYPRTAEWRTVGDEIASRPAAIAGALIVPCRIGQVRLFDLVTERDRRAPFQPKLESGVDYPWSPPMPLSDSEFLISDGRTRLYRVGFVEDPTPHMAAKAEAALRSPVVAPIAFLRDTAYAIDTAGDLSSFSLPDLAPGKDWPSVGPAAWGPVRVGQAVLVGTAKGDLLALDGAGQLRWETPLEHGPLAAPPIASTGFEFVLAAASGVIYWIESDTGSARAKVDAGQPLAGPIHEYQGKLLATARDGTVLVVKRPE